MNYYELFLLLLKQASHRGIKFGAKGYCSFQNHSHGNKKKKSRARYCRAK